MGRIASFKGFFGIRKPIFILMLSSIDAQRRDKSVSAVPQRRDHVPIREGDARELTEKYFRSRSNFFGGNEPEPFFESDCAPGGRLVEIREAEPQRHRLALTQFGVLQKSWRKFTSKDTQLTK
jgi:hypothetical protein